MDKKIQEQMKKVYITNHWRDQESRSGSGSNQQNTAQLVHELPYVINQLKVKSILDIPCGDFAWMPRVLANISDEVVYHGADIVPDIIENNQKFATDKVYFSCLDITSDNLPYADLVIVRDCLNHLPLNKAFEALRNIKHSGIKYLALTNFNWRSNIHNYDIDNEDGVKWRRLNFTLPPFSFVNPIDVIVENSFEPLGRDKTLAIWELSSLKTL